jgi:hypothetical protein
MPVVPAVGAGRALVIDATAGVLIQRLFTLCLPPIWG